jgi:predicted GNAT superfamily acetyltransferase
VTSTISRLDTVAAVGRAVALFAEVWQTGSPPVAVNLVRAVDHAGGYAYGAYDGDAMVGASVAFLGGTPGDVHLYSHITGVLVRRGGVGRALKEHQREWALRRGIQRVLWTYDPLVRRNAAFNIAALGARPTAYLADFYGPMDDGVNRGDETDRLLVEWHLTGPASAGAAERTVHVPDDVEALRRNDPEAARAWRHRVRDELGGAMADGWAVTGFDERGYLLSPRRPRRSS